MNIRRAQIGDAETIQVLLAQLGYPTLDGLIERRLAVLAGNSEHADLVYELEGSIIGFLSLHFIPQIAFDADYAIISYLVVADAARGKGIGRLLESYAEKMARERKCKRIFLQSNAKRVDAHRFYRRQGYEEYGKTFIKYLV
jgi:GNAT superfamily N-acetyltransferase